jgi:hypothetical protein
MKLPKLEPQSDNTFILLENYEILGIWIPAGFKTNGSNIPRLLWWWIPPFKPKYLPAVILHDWLTRDDTEVQFSYANNKFKEALQLIEKSIYTTSMYKAVELYRILKNYK